MEQVRGGAGLTLDTEVSPVLPDRYRVDGILGRGGFGTVLRAWDHQLGRPCAIKVARDATKTERLVREARLAASLRGAHSVRIFDVGVLESGAPYVVMEQLQGRTLSDYLSHTPKVEWALAVEWMEQVCLGLEEAHRAGLVHRDVKPSNLFLVQDPISGKTLVKLLDFGLARLLVSQEGPLTDSELVLGSPSYMSPEQVRNAPVGPPSDIWSVGVVLYQLLSGTRPFAHSSKSATLAAIVADPPFPLEEFAPHLPRGLIQIVERCLNRRPQDRFESAWELARQLRELRAGASDLAEGAIVDVNSSRTRETETESMSAPQKKRSRVRSFAPWMGLSFALALAATWVQRKPPTRSTTQSASLNAAPDGGSDRTRGTSAREQAQGTEARALDAPVEARGVNLADSAVAAPGVAEPPPSSSAEDSTLEKQAPAQRTPAPKVDEAVKASATSSNSDQGQNKPGLFEEPDF